MYCHAFYVVVNSFEHFCVGASHAEVPSEGRGGAKVGASYSDGVEVVVVGWV